MCDLLRGIKDLEDTLSRIFDKQTAEAMVRQSYQGKVRELRLLKCQIRVIKECGDSKNALEKIVTTFRSEEKEAIVCVNKCKFCSDYGLNCPVEIRLS